VALRSRAAVLTESSDARDSSAGGRASDIRLGGDLDDLELFILGVSQGHVDGLVVNKAIELEGVQVHDVASLARKLLAVALDQKARVVADNQPATAEFLA